VLFSSVNNYWDPSQFFFLIFGLLPNTPISPSSSSHWSYSQIKAQHIQKTTEISLKYSYPGLWIFKNFVLKHGYKIRGKSRMLSVEKPWKHGRHPPSELSPWQRYQSKTTQVFFINTCELYVTSWNLSEEVNFSVVRKFLNFLSAPSQTVAPTP